MPRNVSRWLSVIGVASGLTACEEGATVDVVQSSAGIVFVVTRLGTSKVACVTSAEVTPVDPVGAAPSWEVASPPRGDCAARFTYGLVPAGFSSGTPTTPLIAGRSYRVDVSGTGFSGGTTFVVRARR